MMRTHYCGDLNKTHIGETVTLCGWAHRRRDHGGVIFIDLRDREGIAQIVIDPDTKETFATAESIRNEFVLKVICTVRARPEGTVNLNIPTGEVEILVKELKVLNKSLVPPFTIEDETDGGDELRMKYRYLDIRRNPVKNNLIFRSKVAIETRKYLSDQGFIEVETPVLIKSTPEGARDFVVPSRMNEGQFYALPQSPQTFKQLLMVGGLDKYFQIVKCFRDEDLRADRQPEFTQIDCEMAFVEQEDILNMFEGLIKHLFKSVRNVELDEKFPRMTYAEAMERYGSDKPDIRFGMEFVDLTTLAQGKGFSIFDNSEAVLAINAEQCGVYTRKQLDALVDWVKRPQIGAMGLVYVKYNEDGTLKSTVDKFYSEADLAQWAKAANAKPGDLIFFKTSRRDVINHVGIITENNNGEISFIHASTSSGVVISSLLESYYKNAFAKIKRIIE